jgi:serine/threonine protein kinase
MALDPGTQFGPYEISSAIGAGGMGEVYRARDTRLDREVAVKVLPTDFAANAALLARFRREAQVISSLSHPHICTLFDVGEQDGSHYLVMELIDGESLADALTRGALPLPQVLRYGAQIAEALDAAHRQGIVHRDVKPGNVMLTKSGAKLLDFGLATAVETAAPAGTSTQMETRAKPLTEKGTVIGTFQYMAPEQLEGLEADPRTDLFGLGALLYEMATGRRAFDGESRTSLIAAIVSSQPEPISQVVQLTPPALDHVVLKCLEKDPDDRWQSARDVAAQLRWIGEAGSQAGTPAQVTVRRKRAPRSTRTPVPV